MPNKPGELLELYDRELKPLLAARKLGSFDQIDLVAERLRRAIAKQRRLNVGFVGESQVGKSTLINTLLDQRVLPSGGIGPLTAQATNVTFGDTDRLQVAYQTREALNRLRFGIERYLERSGEIDRKRETYEFPSDTKELMSAIAEGGAEEPTYEDGVVRGRLSTYGEHMLSQARAMFCEHDDDDVERTTLLDCLRAVLARAPRMSDQALEDYWPRIIEVRRIMGSQATFDRAKLKVAKKFNKAVRLHAAGWLAPLVASLELELDSAFLRHYNVVDLPGVGVVGDPAGRVAEGFVRNEGDVLVLVATNKGISSSLAELIEKTGVITKLLFGDQAGVDPVHLVVAITHLDDVARDRFNQARQEALDDGEPPPDPAAIFRGLAERMSKRVRRMIGDTLRSSQAFDGLSPAMRERREATVRALCESMDVVCVSGPDYLNLKAGWSEEAFLEREADTGVPALREALNQVAERVHAAQAKVTRRAYDELRLGLEGHLAILARRNREGGPSAEDWETFRVGLRQAAAPLRGRLKQATDDGLELLREGLPTRIEQLCHDAEEFAVGRLETMSQEAAALRYPSLNAALTRGGVWEKQGLDYPGDLARAYVDWIACGWSPLVVQAIQRIVDEIAETARGLIEELCVAAIKLWPKGLPKQVFEIQRELLLGVSQASTFWTAEQLEAMREAVAVELVEALIEPIEAACRGAVSRGDNTGKGAKARILETFREAGEAAVKQGRAAAQQLVTDRYRAMLDELSQSYLATAQDPLAQALAALADDGIETIKLEAAERRKLLTALEAAEAKLADLGPRNALVSARAI